MASRRKPKKRPTKKKRRVKKRAPSRRPAKKRRPAKTRRKLKKARRVKKQRTKRRSPKKNRTNRKRRTKKKSRNTKKRRKPNKRTSRRTKRTRRNQKKRRPVKKKQNSKKRVKKKRVNKKRIKKKRRTTKKKKRTLKKRKRTSAQRNQKKRRPVKKKRNTKKRVKKKRVNKKRIKKKRRTVKKRSKTKKRRTSTKTKRRTVKKKRTTKRRPLKRRNTRTKRKLQKRKKTKPVSSRRNWINWPTKKLLDMRICDLHIRIERTELAGRIRQLYAELQARGLVFRPHFWLSDEWFSPDGVPGVAIPFYLAHPRLKQLEKEIMLDVEGGRKEHCLKLLRHEAAHAMLNAYQFHRRRDWQQQFGKSSTKYPDTYLPKPYSKSYVIHLDNWYAQSHPHEDWAETFAVWLKPNSDWRKRYRGWAALKKLEYVERIMLESRGKRPKVRNNKQVTALRSMKMTLREYYDNKQQRFAVDSPEFFDRDLRKLFSDEAEFKKNEKASRYIRRVRGDIIDIVSRWTSEYDYRINEVLKEMTERCNELKLRVTKDEQSMKPEMVGCLTMLVMNKLHSGGFHVSL